MRPADPCINETSLAHASFSKSASCAPSVNARSAGAYSQKTHPRQGRGMSSTLVCVSARISRATRAPSSQKLERTIQAARRTPSQRTRAVPRCAAVRSSAQRLLDSARRLTDAMLVLDQREANELVARAPEARARRYRDLALAQQQLRELNRAELLVFVRDLGPHEHRRLRSEEHTSELQSPYVI